ncbi:MAG TPA: GTPase HflX [Candidatus Omnitrophica bacterium]|nr:MAG: GTPase HflX [Omnitrophica WOR_2 bacterium GWA2_63_20]OGX33062.1 MAG: GTPase HflX [Omnitrophica WOR_2 bacterium RIFCSPHIGHO2_12_FULL_64_13]OGX35434.1 MAG: GTPase HflX [Omnitrophica WOR_2 bacterium RIFCSPHIGHO2_02_FULL_63_39]OGX44187.1 MAG: GTPase HflX [Omnitrophica WOR_2 bacterium RIFCSPLOWO2_02_FULL_63_16]OGX50323.1 MAG: GTPase HflX [Omnitrophica WOR_2 bacterium RIFCSPLOWO2_12_FULL_63_16]HBH97911.1 GTPase HflX [Candidatus Omnitrophota bacterium]
MERALLVVIEFDRRKPGRAHHAWSLSDEASELEELARSAGCEVAGSVPVRRHDPIAGTLIGSGKLEEIHQQVHDTKARVVVFNEELSPAQQRNIEDIVGIKTIDRTQLILDIFAQRAKSQEGKVQVELAQLRYLLPRLVGKGVLLSRLGGGIGTRGPGEQKLEVDRRRIRERISRLNRELVKLGSRREATRQRRKDARVPVVALVGYTNAGKTTLLNRLTGAQSPAEQRLFTTLDPLARRLRLSGDLTVVLTDTVGFLHRLPHHLIEAFTATLEETRDADLLLHVVDASHPQALEQIEAVEDVLRALQLETKPLVTALNKCDQVTAQDGAAMLQRQLPEAVVISAIRGDGLERLLETITQHLSDAPR